MRYIEFLNIEEIILLFDTEKGNFARTKIFERLAKENPKHKKDIFDFQKLGVVKFDNGNRWNGASKRWKFDLEKFLSQPIGNNRIILQETNYFINYANGNRELEITEDESIDLINQICQNFINIIGDAEETLNKAIATESIFTNGFNPVVLSSDSDLT